MYPAPKIKESYVPQPNMFSRSYILAAIDSQCTTLYRPLIVTFALFSTVSKILPFYTPRANCVSKKTRA